MTERVAHPSFQQAQQAYRLAAQADRRFAPHADVAFQRLAELGKGGMGAVYRVRDHRLGREAALKLMLGDQDPQGAERFQREVQITAHLEHPSIPPVYEAGVTAGGHPYLLLRVIEGETLSARVAAAHKAGAPLTSPPVHELLEALVKVGEAVAYAHGEGVIHRDLKPDNVIVGRFGQVMVMDWGLARDVRQSETTDAAFRASLPPPAEVAGDGTVPPPRRRAGGTPELTQTGATLGTPGYMSPEQAGGEPVDARTDVFALGAILSVVLTGRPPVEGETAMNRIARTVKGELVLPNARRPDVPPELQSLAAAALAVDVDERLPSAEVFVSELRAYLAGRALSVHRYGVGERLRRWVRRHPTLLIASLLAALVVASVAAVATLRLRLEDAESRARQRDEERRLRAEEAERLRSLLASLDRVYRAAQLGRVDEVRSGIEAVLQRGGRTPELLLMCARALIEVGELEEALALVREAGAAGADPLGIALLEHHLGDAGDRDEFFSRAGTARLEAQAAAGNPLAALYVEAATCMDQKRYTDALRVYERLQELTPGSRQALLGVGLAHYYLGEYARATEVFDRAVDRWPDLWLAWMFRAETLLAWGEHARALEDAKRAVELKPQDSAPLRLCATLCMRLDDPSSAVAYVDRAMRLAPDEGPTLLLRAELSLLLGRPQESVDAALRALEAGGVEEHYVRYLLASARYRLQQWDQAAADIERAVALQADTYKYLDLRARLRAEREDFPAALTDLNRMAELEPQRSDAYVNRGAVRFALGDLRGAIEDLEQALRDPQLRDAAGVQRQLEVLRARAAGSPDRR